MGVLTEQRILEISRMNGKAGTPGIVRQAMLETTDKIIEMIEDDKEGRTLSQRLALGELANKIREL